MYHSISYDVQRIYICICVGTHIHVYSYTHSDDSLINLISEIVFYIKWRDTNGRLWLDPTRPDPSHDSLLQQTHMMYIYIYINMFVRIILKETVVHGSALCPQHTPKTGWCPTPHGRNNELLSSLFLYNHYFLFHYPILRGPDPAVTQPKHSPSCGKDYEIKS